MENYDVTAYDTRLSKRFLVAVCLFHTVVMQSNCLTNRQVSFTVWQYSRWRKEMVKDVPM